MGHLSMFVGSETIPAIAALEEYYNADAEKELIAGTIPATEHSVMCAGGEGDDEFETFKRLITEVYPSGFVSIVSDTWDYWKVINDYLPRLKKEILSREGRVVVRPDSGCPEDIICGLKKQDLDELCYHEIHDLEPQVLGSYEMLWNIFGGEINEKGYRVLNPKIGIIYGDSITMERQKEIYKRLEEKGFAATNLVLGIGSYTYQYRTRDSLGFAMKATWCQINGEGKEIYKQPKTDSGLKNSLKGLIVVTKEGGKIVARDMQTKEAEENGTDLVTVFKDGKILREYCLHEIRQTISENL